MRSFLLIVGLLVAVGLAFAMGVFVGVRYDGAAPGSPEVADADTGRGTGESGGGADASEQSAAGGSKTPSDQTGGTAGNGETAGNGGGDASGTSGGGRDAGGSGGDGSPGSSTTAGDAKTRNGGSGADSRGDGAGSKDGGNSGDTWLSEAVPEPGDDEAVSADAAAGGVVGAGRPGPPDVLTPTETRPGAPVYAVQTAHAVPRHRAVELARRLDGEDATAQVIPVFDADGRSGAQSNGARSHVRLAAFAERQSAAAAAERGMRELDVRLRVVRVRRPEGASGSPKDAANSGSTGGDGAGAS